jgi:pimeloyl-ACP methyl ester carboxylesterase
VRRAARVTANVLVCGNAWMLGNSPLERALETVAAGTLRTAGRLGKLTRVLRHLGTEPAMFFTAASLLGGVGRSTPREPVDALIANVRQLDVRLMAALARGYLAHDGRALLSRVTQPTLQVIGGLDRLAPPEHAARIAELLVDVQTTVLPRCTHLAPVEDPLEVHRAVRAFLRPAS